MDGWSCRPVRDPREIDLAFAIRREVFVREQGVPEDMEFDGEDERAVHFLCTTPDGEPAGCGRLLRAPDGWHLQRIAVRQPFRGRGAGSAIVRAMAASARERGAGEVVALVQARAAPFYIGLGFELESEVVMEAGIPHHRARLSLTRGA